MLNAVRLEPPNPPSPICPLRLIFDMVNSTRHVVSTKSAFSLTHQKNGVRLLTQWGTLDHSTPGTLDDLKSKLGQTCFIASFQKNVLVLLSDCCLGRTTDSPRHVLGQLNCNRLSLAIDINQANQATIHNDAHPVLPRNFCSTFRFQYNVCAAYCRNILALVFKWVDIES